MVLTPEIAKLLVSASLEAVPLTAASIALSKKLTKDKPTVTESSYKIITDYVKSLGIRGARASEDDMTKLGFGDDVTDQNYATVYTKEVRQALASAYRTGVAKKDFSEFLSIIAHKEELMDKRGDDDFQDTYNKITGRNKQLDNYSDKVSSLSSLINKKFLTTGKLSRMVKNGEIAPVDFWSLLSSANYAEKTMNSAVPYISTLQEAQKSLLGNKDGLVNDQDITIDEEIGEFLNRIGISVQASEVAEDPINSSFPKELSFEEAITGQGVPDSFLQEVNANGELVSVAENPTYDKMSKFLSDNRDLSNTGLRAQMMAGKQVYSVIMSSLVKEKLALIEAGKGLHIRDMNPQKIEQMEKILNLDKNETIATVINRVSGYANYLDNILHPELNKNFNQVEHTRMGDFKQSDIASAMLSGCLEMNFGDIVESHDEQLELLARRINTNCVRLGAYSEKTDKTFLKSLLIATSNENLGLQYDGELECKENGEHGHFFKEENVFSTPNKQLFLPLTLITDAGVYKTQVEYTRDIKTLVDNGGKAELLEIAKQNLNGTANNHGTNPEANLRFLTPDNLLIGSNPVFAQVLGKYTQTQQNERSEVNVGKGGFGGLGDGRARGENLPLLFRDLELYQQYKAQAKKTISGFLFRPMNVPVQTQMEGGNFERETQTEPPVGRRQEDTTPIMGLPGGARPRREQPQERPEVATERPNEEETSQGEESPQYENSTDNSQHDENEPEIITAEVLSRYKDLNTFNEDLANGKIRFYDYKKDSVERKEQPILSPREVNDSSTPDTSLYNAQEDFIDRTNELFKMGLNQRQVFKVITIEKSANSPLSEKYVGDYSDAGRYDLSIEEVFDKGYDLKSLLSQPVPEDKENDTLPPKLQAFFSKHGVSPVQMQIVEHLSKLGYDSHRVEDIMFLSGIPIPDSDRFRVKRQKQDNSQTESTTNASSQETEIDSSNYAESQMPLTPNRSDYTEDEWQELESLRDKEADNNASADNESTQDSKNGGRKGFFGRHRSQKAEVKDEEKTENVSSTTDTETKEEINPDDYKVDSSSTYKSTSRRPSFKNIFEKKHREVSDEEPYPNEDVSDEYVKDIDEGINSYADKVIEDIKNDSQDSLENDESGYFDEGEEEQVDSSLQSASDQLNQQLEKEEESIYTPDEKKLEDGEDMDALFKAFNFKQYNSYMNDDQGQEP